MCSHMIQSHTPSAWPVLLKLLHISFQICIWALQLWMFTTLCRTSATCSEALHSTRNCRSVHAYQHFLSAGVLLDSYFASISTKAELTFTCKSTMTLNHIGRDSRATPFS